MVAVAERRRMELIKELRDYYALYGTPPVENQNSRGYMLAAHIRKARASGLLMATDLGPPPASAVAPLTPAPAAGLGTPQAELAELDA